MQLPTIPLAAKIGAGALAALALTGGAAAVGAHLASARASMPAPIVAAGPSPAPATKPAPKANPAARAVNMAILQAEAGILGITVKQLNADLKQGTPVQQLAGARGLDESQFSAQLVNAVTPLLDKDVTDGTLTAAQEQSALKKLGKTVPHWTLPARKAAPSPAPPSPGS
jgi:hypothetical protein